MDILDDYNLVQIVTEPTRHDNVLDLILTSNPTLVSKVECLPGLSDHDIVLAEVAIKPAQTKQKRRKIHLYNKVDWTTFRSKLTDYQTKFLSEHHGKAVEQLWSDFTDKLDQLTDQCIPTKVIKGKPSLPWISREIKRLRKFRGQQPAGPAGDGETPVASAKCLMSLIGHLLRPVGTSPPCFSFTRFIVEQCLLKKTSI